ncbi:mitochondrial amidoxime-reducing component 1-like [Xylocopa sonorina]|uniref:mitochondrial amidoxime-reducing component 1-like n=1 Tax=Xylocopa sonorina TaxID=1818115 RepID=UPI00403B020A
MILDKMRLTYVSATAVGAGTAVVVLWWWWTKRQKEKPPLQWRKVGELSDLIMYPVKSLGPVRMNKMECTILGLKTGWLRDRSLMVTDMKGHFVTARQWPKMVQIKCTIFDSILTLSAPGMVAEVIDLSQVKGKGFCVTVWGNPVNVQDCGEGPAKWLSRFLLHEDTGLRLVYHPWSYSTKHWKAKIRKQFAINDDDVGFYADEMSYSVINESSVTDLNTRLDEPVTPGHFRSNFVVRGATPYEEDCWSWLKIGNVTFRCIKPIARCVFTTIDPETGVKNPNVQPLNTLKSYRQIWNPEIRALIGESPAMGLHLGLRGPGGTVQLGDPVYVGVPDQQPLLISGP